MIKIKINKRILKKIAIQLLIVSGLVFILSQVSFAAYQINDDQIKSLNNGLAWMGAIQSALTSFFYPVLVMIGQLLDGSVLFGNGMENHLRAIWMQVRNLVNILFVISLLGVAIYNIFGIGDENSTYSIKSMLPKIIIGIIAVNFSFFGMKVALDAVNIMTVSVFSIASDVDLSGAVTDDEDISRICHQMNLIEENGDTLEAKAENFKKQYEFRKAQDAYRIVQKGNKLCKLPDIPAGISTAEEIKNLLNKGKTDAGQKCDLTKLNTDYDKALKGTDKLKMCKVEDNKIVFNKNGKDLIQGKFNKNSAAMLMATNLLKVHKFKQVDVNIKSISPLVTANILSILLYIIYMAAFFALFIVLVARMIVLWLAMAFSPILVLSAIIPAVKDAIGGESIGKLVKNAIAPLLIAAGMTIGWIMLNALGSLKNGLQTSGSIVGGDFGTYIVPINGFQDLLISVGTLAVIWLAVFEGAKGTIAEGAVNIISGGLKEAGKFVATAPYKFMPMVPIKTPDGTQPFTLKDIATLPEEGIDRLNRQVSRNKLADSIFGKDRSPRGKKMLDVISAGDVKNPVARTHATIAYDKLDLGNKDVQNKIKKIYTKNKEKFNNDDKNISELYKNYINANDDKARYETGDKLLKALQKKKVDNNDKLDKLSNKQSSEDQKKLVKQSGISNTFANWNNNKKDNFIKKLGDIENAIKVAANNGSYKLADELKKYKIEREISSNPQAFKYVAPTFANAQALSYISDKNTTNNPLDKADMSKPEDSQNGARNAVIKAVSGIQGKISDYMDNLANSGAVAKNSDKYKYIEAVLKDEATNNNNFGLKN